MSVEQLFDDGSDAGNVYPDESRDVLEARDRSITAHGDWREEMALSFNFVAGHQWHDDDKSRLEENDRPAVVFNRTAPIIDAVAGYELDNRREVHYRPRGVADGDGMIAEAFTEMARYVRDGIDANDEESEAYRDLLICGMGWTETWVDYDEDPLGTIRITRLPPDEMRWDENARAGNLSDAEWIQRETWWEPADVEATWPDKYDEIGATKAENYQQDDFLSETHDATESWKYENDQSGKNDTSNRIRIIQHQYRIREDVYLFPRPDTGNFITLKEEQWNAIKERLPALESRVRKTRRWMYYQKIVAGDVLVEESETPTPDGFGFQCMTGKRDESTNNFYGLVRGLIDPQKWANVFLSAALNTFMHAAKGGVMVEEDAIMDKDAFEDQWASADAVLWLESGALQAGKIQPKEQSVIPPALDKLLEFAIGSLRDCSGVNLEMLGMVGHDQSGKLEVERKQSALTILAPFTNALKRYRKREGRVLLGLMSSVFTPVLVQRIINREVPQWNDEQVRQFDIVVDDAPNSPNLKHEVWQQMKEIVPAMVKAGMPIPPMLLKYTPLPESASQEWMQWLEQNTGGGDTQQMEAQLQELQAALQKAQQQLQENNAKIAVAQMKAQTDMAEIAMEERTHERRIAGQERLKQLEILANANISQADRELRRQEIEGRFQVETARIEQAMQAATLQARTTLQTTADNNNTKLQTADEQNESREKIAEMQARTTLAQSRLNAQLSGDNNNG